MVTPNQNQVTRKVTKSDESNVFDSGLRFNPTPVGSSGTEVFAGYFSEEYLLALRGRKAMKVWDEMRRSEPQIMMLVNAIFNPIKAGNWDIQPGDKSPQAKLIADHMDFILKECIDFDNFIQEAMTLLIFGFSIFEPIHNVVMDHPKWGTFNGLKALAFRSQKTIERWHIERYTGNLEGVEQFVYSDVGDNAFIPSDFLLVFTHMKEGDNYEGISALRSMYGSYVRKGLYQRLAAIGVERNALGTPVGTVPKGKQKESQIENFKKILGSYTSHESSYIMKPEGWNIEILKGEFDADKIKELIILENTEMINSVVANFLALGTNGGGGAYALGSDLSDFFLSGIQSYADLISGVINRKLLPNLVKLNYGPQEAYPKIKCTGINDKAGKEFSDIVVALTGAQLLTPDMPLKEFLRKQFKLPETDPSTAVPVSPAPTVPTSTIPTSPTTTNPPSTTGAQLTEHAKTIKLDAAYRAAFDKKKSKLKVTMQAGLHDMLDRCLKSARSKWNSTTASNRVKIGPQLYLPGAAAYKKSLQDALAEIASSAISSAKKDAPAAKKLSSYDVSIKLADSGFYDALPPNIKKIVQAQAALLSGSQVADIEKIVKFQFTSSAASSEDIDNVINETENAATDAIEGSTKAGMSIDAAASNAVAQTQNQTRLEIFFEPEVIDTIESFTFTNEDPVSEICQELNGTTWAVGDSDLDKYSPPLHHNCKSRLVPNMKGDSGNPEIDRGTPVTQKALDSITLSCCVRNKA